ncbi:hypothetical protein AVEN_269882-1 [Araneus ventricosus]|uniref:Uncharacterized protein n=1 Tax=Araneus ventricosus TaxID=182803 RepID=A0A4Y2FJT3_ARAVE|nr:hypothetical protein AVEN_269882-1 [Araneus ventricosus]
MAHLAKSCQGLVLKGKSSVGKNDLGIHRTHTTWKSDLASVLPDAITATEPVEWTWDDGSVQSESNVTKKLSVWCRELEKRRTDMRYKQRPGPPPQSHWKNLTTEWTSKQMIFIRFRPLKKHLENQTYVGNFRTYAEVQ